MTPAEDAKESFGRPVGIDEEEAFIQGIAHPVRGGGPGLARQGTEQHLHRTAEVVEVIAGVVAHRAAGRLIAASGSPGLVGKLCGGKRDVFRDGGSHFLDVAEDFLRLVHRQERSPHSKAWSCAWMLPKR